MRGGRHYGLARHALVLAGGGVTGGLWELGVLLALDELAPDFRVNDFDLYVGTSAGAILASLVANGVPPQQIREAFVSDRGTLPRLSGACFLHVPWRRWAETVTRVAAALPGVVADVWSRWDEVLLLDTLFGLTRHLPNGVFALDGLETWVREVLERAGGTDDFRRLPSRLLIPATVLDTGAIHVFGATRGESTPISRAVVASAALPVVYEPVRIDGVDYVDGAVSKTANVGLAVRRGAKLVVALNPLRPLVRDRAERIADGGAPAVAGQAFRITMQRRLHDGLRRHALEHPGTEVVLLEPYEADVELFDVPLMTYDLRHEVIRRGYRTTVKTILGRWEHYRALFQRHGIALVDRDDLERRARAWQSAASHAA